MSVQNYGNLGVYVGEQNVISFQLGDGTPWHERKSGTSDDEDWGTTPLIGDSPLMLQMNGYRILARGTDNRLPNEIEQMIHTNRILPGLLDKQINILNGKGLMPYIPKFEKKKLVREWQECNELTDWLDSWVDNGMDSHQQFAESLIRRYYFFEDFFVKWRFNRSRRIGSKPVAGMELIDNKRARLATRRQVDPLHEDLEYRDFKSVFVGNWNAGVDYRFKRYDMLNMKNPYSHKVAVSHHRNEAVGHHYGLNKFFEGTKPWLKGTNKTPLYINSYLENSFGSNVHVIIPAAWLDLKRDMLERLCEDNEKLQEAGEPLVNIRDKVTGETITLGTEYKEQYLIQYTNMEVKKLSKYLSGTKNQGKIFVSNSFQNGEKEEVRWKIEVIDLKYKEYINSLISYDKRADEVLTTSKGIDSSISSISKDGIISKSGSDLYYNYLIYLHNLSIPERICSEPFNMAIRINFPHLYKQGFRLGFYNDAPQRLEDTPPEDRLQSQVNNNANQLSRIENLLIEIQNGNN